MKISGVSVAGVALGLALARMTFAGPSQATTAAGKAARFTLAPRLRTTTLAAHGPAVRGLHGTAAAGATVPAIQTFSSSFTSAGVKYPYTMVGTSPNGPAGRTIVKTTLQPLSIYVTDAGVSVSVPSTTVSRVKNSGFFNAKAFPGETGQFSDIYQRTQFWGALDNGKKNWHVKLAAPVVPATRTLTIPTGLGAVQIVHKVRVALADVTTFDALIQPYLTRDAGDVLTLIVLHNVILCDFSCGIGGYHGVYVDSRGPHTYAVQSILDSAIYGPASGDYGLSVMSHEIAEWLADPYINNLVPVWESPLASQYGCSNALEVGDPLVGVNKKIDGEVYQDEAYLPWFSRAASHSWQGRYSWFKTFTEPSPSCAF